MVASAERHPERTLATLRQPEFSGTWNAPRGRPTENDGLAGHLIAKRGHTRRSAAECGGWVADAADFRALEIRRASSWLADGSGCS